MLHKFNRKVSGIYFHFYYSLENPKLIFVNVYLNLGEGSTPEQAALVHNFLYSGGKSYTSTPQLIHTHTL